MRRFALVLVMVVLALGLVGWNAGRFIGAEARVRTKDLSFLPSPVVGHLLAVGHQSTVAKLRWIDSFAYFQLQLDRKDDRVAGTGESAFVRLYDLLIGLDGHFLPFYEHAVLNLGGIQDRPGETLSVIQKGLLHLPHDPQLWRLLAVQLYSSYKWEQKQPQAFDQILNAWYAAMEDEQQARQVWDWKAAFGRRREPGLDQLPYWLTQLTNAQGPTREFILQTVREQISRYGETRLTSLVGRYKTQRGHPPVMLQDVLTPELIRQEWPAGVPNEAPLRRTAGGWTLRHDAFGQPYRLVDGATVLSDGVAQFRYRGRVQAAITALEAAAVKEGRWPKDLEECRTMGVILDPPPANGVWHLEGKTLRVDWTPTPEGPWSPSAP